MSKESKTGKVTFQFEGEAIDYEFALPTEAEAKKIMQKTTPLLVVKPASVDVTDEEYATVKKAVDEIKANVKTSLGTRGRIYGALKVNRESLLVKKYTGKARSQRFVLAMKSIKSNVGDRYVDIEVWKGRETMRRVKDKSGKLIERTTRKRMALAVNLTNSKYVEYWHQESEMRRVL